MKHYLLLWLIIATMPCFGQGGSLRVLSIQPTERIVPLDTLSMVNGSVRIVPAVDDSLYHIDHVRALFYWYGDLPAPKLTLSYRVLPFRWDQAYALRDSSYQKTLGRKDWNPFASIGYEPEDPIFTGGLNRSGSISRGITVGNNQDLAVNSSLNLQLGGFLSEKVQIEASITDQNIPIQPDGNTRQLQDFDQVYIRFFDEQHSLTAGDFWIKGEEGYFMRYLKRGQGLTYWFSESDTTGWRASASAAISKGKFARNIIQGIEGNQGPYRLTGDQNEPFIIVLSGTERVYIDGKLLVRGQDYDYVIDYNAAEIRFTPRNQITKDRRIIVEFQYSDKNYARSMVQGAASYRAGNWKGWIGIFSEQDGRNQPLLQELDDADRDILALAGDANPLANSIDSIGFDDNLVMYKQVDTVVNATNYTVLVNSYNPDSAFYRAVFSNVGQNNGNYVLAEYGPVGKIYKWVAPVLGVPQGSYEPVRLLVAPNRNQMFTGGFRYQQGKKSDVFFEAAVSNNDRNTFSDIQNGDNVGFGLKSDGQFTLLGGTGKKAATRVGYRAEHVHRHFRFVERFRSVEFERDWNVLNQVLSGDQTAGEVFIRHEKSREYMLELQGKTFIVPGSYTGYKQEILSRGALSGLAWNVIGSHLSADVGIERSRFIRHRGQVSKEIGPFKLGYRDEHELNTRYVEGTDSLLLSSYQFYDGELFVASNDTTGLAGGVSVRMRLESRPQEGALTRASEAMHYGGFFDINRSRAHRLSGKLYYRRLNVIDTTLIGSQPEESVTGRLEYQGRLAKGAITWTSFYEVGSGQELKREFQYLEVLPGQGVYAWIDYNENGVKELNEFEIAAFQDQATYIRVFVPSNEYVQVFTNQFTQSLNLTPASVWNQEKKGLKKLLARFQNQSSMRIDRKTSNTSALERYNPFLLSLADSSLISINASFRNSLFFNRISPIFSMEWTAQDVIGKSLLANGYDARRNTLNTLGFRLNLGRKFTLQGEGTLGSRESDAGYVSGRNFDIAYNELNGEFSFQPGTTFRLSFIGERSDKQNILSSARERAILLKTGTQLRLNQVAKGSVEATFNVILIDFSGETNTPLAFEMLESLQPGTNYTWTLGVQRALGKALQLTLNYNGRQSEGTRVIHAGGVQLRAFF